MDAKQIMSADMNDIVFEGRNKAYGAYDLRKKYNRNLNMALALCTAILLLAFLSPYIAEKVFKDDEIMEMKPRETNIELTEAPPLDDKTPPPPPEIEPPKLEIVQNIVPDVVEHDVVNQVRDVVDQLDAPNLGQTNQEGAKVADLNLKAEAPTVVTATQQTTVQDKIEEFADEDPTFPGDYNKYIKDNLIYPQAAAEANLEGNVILKFVVEKDGNITNISVEKGLGMGCTEAAIKVVKGMPNWRPAKMDGHPVRLWNMLTIKFKLN